MCSTQTDQNQDKDEHEQGEHVVDITTHATLSSAHPSFIPTTWPSWGGWRRLLQVLLSFLAKVHFINAVIQVVNHQNIFIRAIVI